VRAAPAGPGDGASGGGDVRAGLSEFSGSKGGQRAEREVPLRELAELGAAGRGRGAAAGAGHGLSRGTRGRERCGGTGSPRGAAAPRPGRAEPESDGRLPERSPSEEFIPELPYQVLLGLKCFLLTFLTEKSLNFPSPHTHFFFFSSLSVTVCKMLYTPADAEFYPHSFPKHFCASRIVPVKETNSLQPCPDKTGHGLNCSEVHLLLEGFC